MNNELIERIENIFCDGTTDYYTVCKLLDDCKAEIERLTKALEASGAPVAWMQIDTKGNPTNLFFNSVPEDDYHTYMPLYTAPPSIDALIAEIDAIVTCAEIVEDEEGVRHYIGEAYAHDEVQAILDKYRGVK